jgi:hypothetical protein
MAAYKEIVSALLGAYQTRADFEDLVFQSGERTLDLIATTGDLTNDIRRVVKVATTERWLHDLLAAAAEDRPNVAELARLRDETRPITVPMADPWKSVMVNGQPLVDRDQIRFAVKDLEGQRSRILIVHGEPTSGKSHTANLVTWRAGENQHQLVQLDLSRLWDAVNGNVAAGARPRLAPRDVAISLCDQLSIDRAIIPQTDEQDSRWAIAFCDRFQARLDPAATYWIVIDEFNKVPVSQQAADFFKELATRVSTTLINVRLVLLGYSDTLSTNVEPGVIREQVSYLREEDLLIYFAELYRIIGRPDDAEGIAESLDRVRSKLTQQDLAVLRELGQALAQELRLVLRKQV